MAANFCLIGHFGKAIGTGFHRALIEDGRRLKVAVKFRGWPFHDKA
jgi:hypothetical protein